MADNSQIVSIYEKAQQDVINKVADVDFFNLKQKQVFFAQVRKILESLDGLTQDFLIKETKKEWNSGIKEVDKAFRGLDIQANFNVIDPKAVDFIVQSLEDIQITSISEVRQVLSNSFSSIQNSVNLIVRNYKNANISEITGQLAEDIGKGQILGKSRKKISEEVYFNLTNKGITGLTYTTESGQLRNLSLKAYVDSLTRSTLVNSRASAVVSRALENGHDLLKISSHSNPSPMCAKWQGRIVSISGKTPGYGTLSEALFNGDYKRGGVLHRFCRHSLTVYIPTDIKFN